MPVEIKKLLAGHLDLVPALFEFLEQAESHDFGGEGSGNWGHGGRPGEIGGSGEGGAGVGTVTGSDVDKLQTQVDSWSGTENRAIATSALQNTGNTNIDVIALKSGDKLAAVAAIESKPGTDYLKVKDIASNEKSGGTRIMAEVARMAASKGKGVALVSMTTSASGFYKKIGMVPDKANDSIYRWTAEQAKGFSKKSFSEFGGEGSGNWGHEGRPGEIGGSGEGGGSAEPKSLLQQVEDKMRAEGTLPAAASKVEATKAVEAPKAKDLKTIEKEYKTAAEEHTREYDKYKEMNKAAWEEKGSKERVAKMDAADKVKERLLSKYATEDKPNDRSVYHKDIASKLPEEQIRNELTQRFGDGVKGISEDKLRDVYASISHNDEVLGKDRVSQIVQKIEVASLKGRAVAAYMSESKRIIINSNKTGDLKGWDDKDDKGERFHPYAGNSPVKAVIDHEIGHGVFSSMSSGSGKIGRVSTVFGREGVSRTISGYASTNTKELAAESWAAHMNGGNNNVVIQYVAGLMGAK